jgi:hypothetical protein
LGGGAGGGQGGWAAAGGLLRAQNLVQLVRHCVNALRLPALRVRGGGCSARLFLGALLVDVLPVILDALRSGGGEWGGSAE